MSSSACLSAVDVRGEASAGAVAGGRAIVGLPETSPGTSTPRIPSASLSAARNQSISH